MRKQNQSANVRPLECSSCGEPLESLLFRFDRKPQCIDCWKELKHGIIAPPYGPIVDECEEDLDDDADDDDLSEDGRIDNAIKAMEDTRDQ